jgi:sugar phosphate isomerase/epimerase
MKYSRRDFIKQSAFATAAVSLAACGGSSTSTATTTASTASEATQYLTGVQLYSIREDMEKDPLGTLKKLAEMGYQYVEHANYKDRKFYGWPAAEFKKVLSDLGMSMPSGHTVLGKQHWDETKNDFTDLWKYTIEDAAIAGQQFVISPWLDDSWRSSEDVLKKYMDVFNKSGELCKKSGMMYGYHNHAFEFSQKLGDQTVYDVILKNTDPAVVMQQLDIGNMINGGGAALEVIAKYPGRFQSMHVKDEVLAPAGGHEKYESTVLGTGVVGVKQVIDEGKKTGGTIHFIIEQESYQGKAALDCVKEDLAIMKSWGY